MILYHGTRQKLNKLERRQAMSPNAEVPTGEQQNAIYLTPDYASAIAMASRPDGITIIDAENKTIEFEDPEKFDPEMDIYIYSVDSSKIPKEHLDQVDDLQYAALVPEITPENEEKMKARRVLDFYELTNWEEKNTKEVSREVGFKVK